MDGRPISANGMQHICFLLVNDPLCELRLSYNDMLRYLSSLLALRWPHWQPSLANKSKIYPTLEKVLICSLKVVASVANVT